MLDLPDCWLPVPVAQWHRGAVLVRPLMAGQPAPGPLYSAPPASAAQAPAAAVPQTLPAGVVALVVQRYLPLEVLRRIATFVENV